MYGLLLFGGPITINHWAGGILLGKDGHVKMRAGTRIGVLCSQLRYVSSRELVEMLTRIGRERRLLDAQLAEQIESPHVADLTGNEEVIGAMMALLARDGLTS